jgi:hypothetical protein
MDFFTAILLAHFAEERNREQKTVCVSAVLAEMHTVFAATLGVAA